MIIKEIEKPIPAEASGKANIPAPMVVPAMIKVLPKIFELRIGVFFYLHLKDILQRLMVENRQATLQNARLMAIL
jgi:hypothetical protein